jgi:DOPA 4,5-dioxygenase
MTAKSLLPASLRRDPEWHFWISTPQHASQAIARTMEPIKEWHFHTYWFAKENHPSAAEALRLHAALLEEIKSDPSFVVVCHGVTGDILPGFEGRPPPLNHRPVGPHLSGSFETWVPQESLPRALSWFTQHRGSLSILIHPLTRYERADHSTHATWLGTPWTIDLETLREDAGAPERQYPELGLGYSKAT